MAKAESVALLSYSTINEYPTEYSKDTGTAIQVIKPENDHSFSLDEEALKKILLSRKVKDSKVIVLSIAGAFRTGKSFLLNFFLRYLYARGSENWNGDPDAPLKGFDWEGGTERKTTGILMWSKPFEVELANGKTACLLLMDTQGAFDCQSTVRDCATVFALSTMLSSVQVYNVMLNIQENELQHLQFFTEYGRLALETSDSKPFQDLYFLVRDWQCPYQYEYGWTGGENFLKKRLEITVDQHEELQQLRLHLRSCFAKIGCCLMPHPGKTAATSQHFVGCLSDLEDDFRLHVEEFVSTLLSPEKLVVKEVNGTKVTGKDLFEYFKEYIKVFQGNQLPELKSIYVATADANNQAAVSKATDLYIERMDLVCGGSRPKVIPEILKRKHYQHRQVAIQLFQSIRKMGGEEKSRGFQNQLEQKLNELHVAYVENNSVKKYSCKQRCYYCCCCQQI